MRYWFFNFEGKFRDGISKYGCTGLFSNAMLVSENEKLARKRLEECLDMEGIDLIKINEFYEFLPDETDMQNPDNIFWISMFEELKKDSDYVFTPWESY